MPNTIVWLSLLSLLLAACSIPGEGSIQLTVPAISTGVSGVSDALLRDAEAMAEELGISIDDAIRRINLQEPIGRLAAELEQQEADTFAGLWIEQEPEFRVVAAFTANGEKTIRPYVENTPLAEPIEVRAAEATLAELVLAQQDANRLLDRLELSAGSGISVQENRVELYVTDRPLFDAALHAADARLPDHLEVITIYEPLAGEPPFEVTPDPAIHFPQLKTRSSSFMAALLAGELVVQEGCLRVSAGEGSESHLVIWQVDYFLNNNEGVLEIWDRNGSVVARVGEEIQMGGGEVALTEELRQQLREPLPERCNGPYWLMGELVFDK